MYLVTNSNLTVELGVDYCGCSCSLVVRRKNIRRKRIQTYKPNQTLIFNHY